MYQSRFDHFGFTLIFAAILATYGLSTVPTQLAYVVSIAALAGGFGVLLAGRWRKPSCLLRSFALVITSILLISMTSVEVTNGTFWKFGTILLLALICVGAFRLPFWWWFWGFLILFTAICILRSVAAGFLVALPLIFLVLAANFLFKMIADNWPNMRAAWSNAKERENPVTATELARLLWPVAVFALLGIWGNILLQAYLVDKMYRNEIVVEQEGMPRHLERDADFTVDLRAGQAIHQILDRGADSRSAVERGTSEAERRILRLFGALEPKPYDTERICKDFIGTAKRKRSTAERLWNRFSRGRTQKVTVDMRKECAAAFGELSVQTGKAFDESTDLIEVEVENATKDLNKSFDEKALSVEAIAIVHVMALADRVRGSLAYLFLGLRFLQIWSWVMLAAALIAAAVNVLGRLLYDKDRSTFRLDFKGSAASETPLRFTAHDKVRLDLAGDFRLPEETQPKPYGVKRWYVAFDAARYGYNTEMDTRTPKLSSCFFRRFANHRLFLTRVDLDATDAAISAALPTQGIVENLQIGVPVDPPTISASGDVKLLDIYLESGRELVFRLTDLIAFSEGIELSSRFSMNVATEIFGLGSFYTVARGEGRIVLRTEGHEHLRSSGQHQFPSGILLAWDHDASFSLAQSLGLRGIWGNSASLVPTDSGLAILDESRPGDPTVVRRIWRILRFAVLPV